MVRTGSSAVKGEGRAAAAAPSTGRNNERRLGGGCEGGSNGALERRGGQAAASPRSVPPARCALSPTARTKPPFQSIHLAERARRPGTRTVEGA